MADVLFKCSGCSARLAADDASVGLILDCSACGQKVVVPKPGISFSCPKCNAGLTAPSGFAGEPFDCPNCETALVVPKASTASPAGGMPSQAADQEPNSAGRCLGCGKSIAPTVAVCLFCGVDQQTGKPRLTLKKDAPVRDEPPNPTQTPLPLTQQCQPSSEVEHKPTPQGQPTAPAAEELESAEDTLRRIRGQRCQCSACGKPVPRDAVGCWACGSKLGMGKPLRPSSIEPHTERLQPTLLFGEVLGFGTGVLFTVLSVVALAVAILLMVQMGQEATGVSGILLLIALPLTLVALRSFGLLRQPWQARLTEWTTLGLVGVFVLVVVWPSDHGRRTSVGGEPAVVGYQKTDAEAAKGEQQNSVAGTAKAATTKIPATFAVDVTVRAFTLNGTRSPRHSITFELLVDGEKVRTFDADSVSQKFEQVPVKFGAKLGGRALWRNGYGAVVKVEQTPLWAVQYATTVNGTYLLQTYENDAPVGQLGFE